MDVAKSSGARLFETEKGECGAVCFHERYKVRKRTKVKTLKVDLYTTTKPDIEAEPGWGGAHESKTHAKNKSCRHAPDHVSVSESTDPGGSGDGFSGPMTS